MVKESTQTLRLKLKVEIKHNDKDLVMFSDTSR
jgi:hypothetical protein